MILFKNVVDGLEKVIKGILALLFALMCIVCFAQVIWRYVLTLPLPWAEELARYLFEWLVFLGVSIGVKNHSHMAVEFFVERLSALPRKIATLIANLISLSFVCTLFYYSIKMFGPLMAQLTPAMEIPMIVPYFAVTIGTALMALNLIYIIIEGFYIS